MTDRLKWHIGDNLRWLAENKGADYLPCGMLHGSFLVQVAQAYEDVCADNRRLRDSDATATAADCEDNPVPKDLQARAVGNAQNTTQPPENPC